MRKSLKKVFCTFMTTVLLLTAIPWQQASAEATVRVSGDVNGDLNVTLRDATLAQKIQLDLVPNVSDMQRKAADMNGNGTVETADAYLIQRFASRDKAVLDGDSSAGIKAYAANKLNRIQFFNALNAERASKGLSKIEYNDAMLTIGQLCCDSWYTQFKNNKSSYDGSLVVNGTNTKYLLAGPYYGFPSSNENARMTSYKAGNVRGDEQFAKVKSDLASNSDDVYVKVLMSSSVKVVYVGEYLLSDDTALWIIGGY